QCSVENVFPLPQLTIYQLDGVRPRSLERARLLPNVTHLRNGAFSVSVTAFIEDRELMAQLDPRNTRGGQLGPTMFECLVEQDVLRHELRKRTLYTPSYGEHCHPYISI